MNRRRLKRRWTSIAPMTVRAMLVWSVFRSYRVMPTGGEAVGARIDVECVDDLAGGFSQPADGHLQVNVPHATLEFHGARITSDTDVLT